MSSSEYPYFCTLTPELIEKAEEDLNEKAERRDRDIQKLREMVIACKGITKNNFLLITIFML